MTLDENKRQLVEAHRAGDWDRAIRLSQERRHIANTAVRYCIDCGSRITYGAMRCSYHANIHRFYRRALPMRFITLLLLLAVTAAHAELFIPPKDGAVVRGNIRYAWDANTETNLAGYRFYHGPASGAYTNVITLGLVTEYALTNVHGGDTVYAVVTAYNVRGLESGPSNEVPFTMPEQPKPPSRLRSMAMELLGVLTQWLKPQTQ